MTDTEYKVEQNDNLVLEDIGSAPSVMPRGTSSVDEDLEQKYGALLSKHRDVAEENIGLMDRVAAAERRNATSSILDKLIVPYAKMAFRYMIGYSICVALLLIASGVNAGWFSHFNLPGSTLDFLVGSTAATVIGLVGMVLTGIFIGARK